jgi:hypothetical protein
VNTSISKRKAFAAVYLVIASVLGDMLFVPVSAQQAENFTYQSTRVSHKVTGWQHGLVKRSPNLGQYYWSPITRYTETKGSRHTGKGARVGGAANNSGNHYVKPRFAPLPENHRAQFSAIEMARSGEVTGKVRSKVNSKSSELRNNTASENCSAVLSYGDSKEAQYSQNLSVSGRLYRRGQ